MRNVQKELPFLALEKTLMLLTEKNVSRQEAHEKIREVSLKAQERKCAGLEVFFTEMLSDSYFDLVCFTIFSLHFYTGMPVGYAKKSSFGGGVFKKSHFRET